MILEALKLKSCVRVVLDALREQSIYFHNMRGEPVWTEEGLAGPGCAELGWTGLGWAELG